MEINFGDGFQNLDYKAYPKMYKVKQMFQCPEIPDGEIEAAVAMQFETTWIKKSISQGNRIAVLVGSRGICCIDRIIRQTVRELKKLGADPFIVPAMASHGGATQAGQQALLESYGITKEKMGVPIISTMEPEKVGETLEGVEVFFDVNAWKADGVIAINRIKAHTAFRGETESGIIKMLAIGAGKQKGAESLHGYGADKFAVLLPEAFEVIKAGANILGGIGIVENSRERPAVIELIPTENILQREKELLKSANQYMAKILIDKFDALIVGETGKNISGDGMDPNVTGRFAVPGMTGGPQYQRMALLDVTPESHGNAVGMGLADVITKKLLRKADFNHMYMNAFTSKMVIPIVKIPMVAENDREAIGVMLRTCVRVQKGKEKVIFIKNTLKLEEIWISEELLKDIEKDERFQVLGGPAVMEFDSEGNLISYK